jgi:hypothetical protein
MAKQIPRMKNHGTFATMHPAKKPIHQILSVGSALPSLRFDGQGYSAIDHVPALIVPNPFEGGEKRYVVLNSGHTFRESELAKLNYLLFPRWGDWAVLRIEAAAEKVVRAGFFNEQWTLDGR